ncbi:hypothetical protein N9J64_00245 [bacterium]|jgi:hypothetical protein|nr:hypothetical protein [bacterium]|tara:strand:- start:346 stop:534 length:189 start_codon:yes stop_codon:yes gene_type:complete
MIQLLYETKKQLKENVGSELEYIETSFFGEEYKSTGTITGCNKKRSWFANVVMQDDKIIQVK